jgi:hypothetical protein
MAHFRGTLRGMRGEASRLGGAGSGITVTARGWDFGIDVYLYVNGEGEDEARIELNSGNGRPSYGYKILGTFTQKDLKKG